MPVQLNTIEIELQIISNFRKLGRSFSTFILSLIISRQLRFYPVAAVSLQFFLFFPFLFSAYDFPSKFIFSRMNFKGDKIKSVFFFIVPSSKSLPD